MNANNVVYYRTNYGSTLDRIETISLPAFDSIDINDAIEFYEINTHIIEGGRKPNWSDEEFSTYADRGNALNKLSLRYFSALSDETIIEKYEAVDISYRKCFWGLFDICKLYEKISDAVFDKLIHTMHVSPEDIFSHKRIVKRYGRVLRNYILENRFGIRIILHTYEQDYTQQLKLYLPEQLTGQDICQYIESYIDSPAPHPNELMAITQMRESKKFPISDEVRLKAKRRYREAFKRVSEAGVSITTEIKVTLVEDQKEEKKAGYSGNSVHCSYSLPWLLDTLDYPSIMNNFIYIFEYADWQQMRCRHVSRHSDEGLFEHIFRSPSSRVYPVNYVFNFANKLATLQMNLYYAFLGQQAIRYEDVLQWCFTEYLQKEFGCSEIRIRFPSEGMSYSEKCRIICTTMDSLIKQFTLYVRNHEIDFELLEMTSGSPSFDQIPSLVADKYVYGNGNLFKSITSILFSDQSFFAHVRRDDGWVSEDNYFYDLISHQKIYVSDYLESYHADLRILEEEKLIIIYADGLITPGDQRKITVLKDLYHNEVISRWHYPASWQSVINEGIERGLLLKTSTLLSPPESHYFNYLLNDAEYCNGFALRNKYLHGNKSGNLNEEEHKQNYYLLLRLFTILAIKMNDDFSLSEQLEKQRSSD